VFIEADAYLSAQTPESITHQNILYLFVKIECNITTTPNMSKLFLSLQVLFCIIFLVHENTFRPLGSSRFYHTNKIRRTAYDILQTANPIVLAAQDVYRRPLDCWDRGVRIPLMARMLITFVSYTLCTKRPLRRANHSFKEVLLCVRVSNFV